MVISYLIQGRPLDPVPPPQKARTLAELFGDRYRTFVFDPVQDLYGVKEDPDLFLRNNPPPITLDEIQHVPELIPALKRFIDRDRKPGMYLIAGSQQWHVMRHLSESLAGRVAIVELSGFSRQENSDISGPSWINSCLDQAPHGTTSGLEGFTPFRSPSLSATEAIWRGGFPEVNTLRDEVIPGWMQGYVSTYLQRDVRTLLNLREETQFGTFLALCASLTTQECNYSQIGRNIGLSSPPPAFVAAGFQPADKPPALCSGGLPACQMVVVDSQDGYRYTHASSTV